MYKPKPLSLFIIAFMVALPVAKLVIAARRTRVDSAFVAAVQKNDDIKAQAALDAGANPNVRLNRGTTLLMASALKGSLHAVHFLVSHGAAVDTQDDDGDTALMRAASKHNIAIVDVLIRSGADVKILDHRGISAQFISEGIGFKDVSERLREGAK